MWCTGVGFLGLYCFRVLGLASSQEAKREMCGEYWNPHHTSTNTPHPAHLNEEPHDQVAVALKLLRYSMVPTSKEVKSITTSYLSQARGSVAGCVGGARD